MKKGLLFVFTCLLCSMFFYSGASDLPTDLNLLKAKLLTLAQNLSPRKKTAFQPKFEKKKFEDADLFINHLKMLFELKSKNHFQLNLPQLKVSNMADNQLSQSEINLNFFKDKNFNYKDHIRKILTVSKIDETKFGKNFVNFFGEPFFGESLIKKNVDETVDLMFRIIKKERRYSQCYVFYHGMNSEIAILPFVYRAIYSWFAAEPRMNNVIVRILNDDFEEFEYAKTKETESMTPIQRFLEKYKKHLFNYNNSHSCEHCGGKSLQQGDKLPIITKLLLSLNIALFGNIWRKSDSEATYDYFLTDYSYASIKAKESLKEIFEKFKFSQKFIDKIIETYKTHMEKTGGQILQIFIDKNIVDQYVYNVSSIIKI